MEFLPIFLRLEGRLAVLVGGGEVASRKIELLRRAGARIRVVAPDLAPQIAELKDIEIRQRVFDPADLDGAELVVAATDDHAVNERVAAEARLRHLPVNVVDDPALCSFIMPAIVDRGRVVAAISTGGVSPILARLIRNRIELALPPSVERLAELAAAWRGRVKKALPGGTDRRRFWEALLGGEAADIDAALAEAAPGQGRLVRITVPVGDPEALTLRALRLLQSADLILHEAGVPDMILEFARRDARRIGFSVPGQPLPAEAERAVEEGKLVVVLTHSPAPRRPSLQRTDRLRRRSLLRSGSGLTH